ncbi:uncharacterized protein LOC123315958 [Coccinella septempunctata]|uniref:uncharacterized protein LOC123315958 n=1 Tax=Coccinella septempunctata TaxID=41139 RepID=UPI001D090E12|nr:uncharacterized protein LOC123315958 [Coccinella septempunctata]
MRMKCMNVVLLYFAVQMVGADHGGKQKISESDSFLKAYEDTKNLDSQISSVTTANRREIFSSYPYTDSGPGHHYGPPLYFPQKNYGPPDPSYGFPEPIYGPTVHGSPKPIFGPQVHQQPIYGPPQPAYGTSQPVHGPLSTLNGIPYSLIESIFDKFKYKLDLFTIGKIILKLVIFKKIVSFIGILCLLLFIPSLKNKNIMQMPQMDDEMFRSFGIN